MDKVRLMDLVEHTVPADAPPAVMRMRAGEPSLFTTPVYPPNSRQWSGEDNYRCKVEMRSERFSNED
ncbi:hypothetical protein RRG08_020667 [Elysia crispata]|uniref:Uncharacterized protein n=1 Tax=Elysia crispata TaxID=231223 RepID=A0AAE0Z4F0_9GAST|nr:hypothetical protein RRG08_020667 [Elysia crispata]